jgi:putative nucleotidyltransferase with HDIG domain
VISINQAIEALGRKALYDVVMLGAMADGFAKEISNTIYGRIVWEHSVAVALLARELSNVLGLRGTEEAFLCGLLHDIGKILLLKGETEKYEAIINKATEAEVLAAERDTFGFTHAEIGGYVTRKWELPDVVCGVIMHHHRPRLAPLSTVITHIVNVADLIANVNGYGLRLEQSENLENSDSAKVLRLAPEQIAQAKGNIQDSLKEVLSTFS